MSAKMTCCGMDAVWVNNGPRLEYWYCNECKAEVFEKKEEQLSFNLDDVPDLQSLPGRWGKALNPPKPLFYPVSRTLVYANATIGGLQQQLASTPTQVAPAAHYWITSSTGPICVKCLYRQSDSGAVLSCPK